MTWVRISDKVWGDPKIYSLPAGACRLWVLALAWANDHETNGALPSMLLGLLKAKRRDASTLVAAGLWSQTEQGWVINKYLKYQPSKESLEARREATKERVKRHRNGVTNADVTPLVTPPPTRPDPSRTDPTEQVSAKDLTGSSDAPRQEHAPTQPGFQDRQTVCPLDLAARAHLLKLPEQMAKALEVSEHDVAACVDEFVAYWTIGGGTGRRQENWLAKLREHVRQTHMRGRLIGMAKAPGFEEHERRKEQERKVAARKRRRQQPEPEQERVPQALRVVLAEEALAAIGGKR